MRTRLLAIVLVPVLGLAGFTAREAKLRIDLASGSRELSEGVERVTQLAPIALLVFREVYVVSAENAGASFGLTIEQVGDLVDTDLEQELVTVRAEIDRRFDAVPPGDAAHALHRRLQDVRVQAGRGEIDHEEFAFWLGEVSSDMSHAAVDALDDAEEWALDLEGSVRVQRALAALRAAEDSALAAYAELGSLGLLLRTVLGADPTDTPGPQRLRELRRFTARLEATALDLDRLATGPVRRIWRSLRDDPDVQRTEAELIAIGEGAAGLPSDVGELAVLFGHALERIAWYYDLAEAAADVAAEEASRLGDEALERLWLTVALAGAVVIGAVALAASMSRSIARPLQRLEAGARRVSAGQLDDFEVPAEGPREVTSVSATLGETVDGLRVIEAQLGALAAGEIDDEVLEHPVSGRLGEFVHHALVRLSHSVAERDALAQRLRHEASHDALTGLTNRAAAAEELRRALARAQRAGSLIAVLYLDLDGFKHVNDHHGHDAGDDLLRVVAERLTGEVRTGDFVGRIGGDEFLVITESAANPHEVVRLGERLIAAVSEPITIGVGVTRVGASVGVAFSLDGGLDADTVLREADVALYRAKAAGRSRVELFDEALRAELERAADLEQALRSAVGRRELELHFQPVVDVTHGRVTGVEALLRWHRPGVGYIPPDQFIPVAEAGDLIIEVDRWVLRQACEHLVGWRHDPVLAELDIAVNISGRHLLSLTVVDDIQQVLEETGADPQRLTVEITETVLFMQSPIVVEHLARMRSLGVRVAIDDFGTGYTSLTQLRTLPADLLKIDRSLVAAAGTAPDSHVLRLLVGTGHALGMRLVAEGVETDAQLSQVRSIGCDLVQGFRYARPTPARDLAATISALETSLR